MFINILQVKELNKGKIKYHIYFMRQTFRYKVSVSGEYPLSFCLKPQTKPLLDVYLMTNLQGKINTWLINGKLYTHWSRLCQCQVLLVWRCQAHLVLALVPGSHTGRCLYESLLCPAEKTNSKIQINHWLMTTDYQGSSWHYSLNCVCLCHLHSFQNPDGTSQVI